MRKQKVIEAWERSRSKPLLKHVATEREKEAAELVERYGEGLLRLAVSMAGVAERTVLREQAIKLLEAPIDTPPQQA